MGQYILIKNGHFTCQHLLDDVTSGEGTETELSMKCFMKNFSGNSELHHEMNVDK